MKCLIVWRTKQDEFQQTEAEIADPATVSAEPNGWIRAAMEAEGGNTSEEISEAIAEGYDLLLAIPAPSRYFV